MVTAAVHNSNRRQYDLTG